MAKHKKDGGIELSAMEQELLIVIKLYGKGIYGLDLMNKINNVRKNNGRGELGIGSLYPALKRMERQKLIKGRWGEESPSEEAGGARRRYYDIDDDGKTALAQTDKYYAELLKLSPTTA